MLTLLTAALLAIGPPDWTPLTFRNIPPLRHEVAKGRITLHVEKSAGGIVRALPAGTRVKSITIRGRIEGTIQSDPAALWKPEADDQYLRVGLIHSGGKPLNAFQRTTAPAWIRTLDKVLCADGRGPTRIDNLILAPHAQWVDKFRQHPSMKQVHERITASPQKDGTFILTATFATPIDALGLWFMADGDDTGSKFKVTITAIEIGQP